MGVLLRQTVRGLIVGSGFFALIFIADFSDPHGAAHAGVLSANSSKVAVYVGVKACQKCHHMPEKGRNQFNQWYLSSHATAFASLSHPASEQIASLSGIDEPAYQTPICLGCHATASATEPWEREPGFFSGDGIQCEFCHGPGSGYMDAEIMSDREAAMSAGLKFPGKDVCMTCHEHKGSHRRTLGELEPFDYPKALEKIKHTGKGTTLPRPETSVENEPLPKDTPTYIGARACATCHENEDRSHIYSKWRLTAHANAYAKLGMPGIIAAGNYPEIEGSPQNSGKCLKCHATGQAPGDAFTEQTFEKTRGVQCESCHGPGSQYADEKIMTDPEAARARGLKDVTARTCQGCHRGYHGKSLDYEAMLEKITHEIDGSGSVANEKIEYKTPFNLAISRDGKLLYAACEASDSLIAIDTKTRKVIGETRVDNLPHGVCISSDETSVFVSCRGTDTVSEIHAKTLKVRRTFPVGDEPHDLMTDSSDRYLYVANAGSNDISVVDLEKGSEIKRLSGGRGTWGMSRSPDNRFIYVTNNLSHFVKFRTPSVSEVTVVDTATAQVVDRIMIPEANLVQGVDFAPDGEFALVTLLRTKNLVPVVRVIQGWVITNGIGILWPDGRVDQLLLDQVNDYFADPTDIAITPDGKYAYVTGGGVNEVAVVDLLKMKAVLKQAGDRQRKEVLPNHLGVPTRYMLKRIPVGNGPRGLVVSPGGDFVYVADALSDTISIIDIGTQTRVASIKLQEHTELTPTRLGERVFHSADITFGRQFSCHSCHPDGGVDALTYDIEPDGLGLNPVDNRTLKGVLDTAPFKWTGKNPSLSRQCGPRLAVFFTRIDPFTPEQVVNLESYICTIPRNPNRYKIKDSYTPAQRRGKMVFERTHTNTGELIPYENRCDTCHPGPYFTNRRKSDVGTMSELDTQGTFDIPHLNNIYETAPYLHDGRSDTLEEIWTRFNPDDKHGVTNDMTKDQLNDLIEYLKSL